MKMWLYSVLLHALSGSFAVVDVNSCFCLFVSVFVCLGFESEWHWLAVNDCKCCNYMAGEFIPCECINCVVCTQCQYITVTFLLGYCTHPKKSSLMVVTCTWSLFSGAFIQLACLTNTRCQYLCQRLFICVVVFFCSLFA